MRLAILMLAAPLAFAQSSTPAPPPNPAATTPALKFEVASIRPTAQLRVVAGFSSSGPRVQLQGYSLYYLLMEAYNLRSYQIHFLHRDERASVFYDIAANAPEGSSPTRDQFRLMLQALLADRFQVKAHFEKQQVPVYALVIAKGGPKLEKSTSDGHTVFGVNGRNQFIETSNITMQDLVLRLNGYLVTGRPIVDRTELSGTYKLRIEATPDWRMAANPQDGDLSIFTAVREQLGLKLEPSTAMADILVVDSFEPPTEN